MQLHVPIKSLLHFFFQNWCPHRYLWPILDSKPARFIRDFVLNFPESLHSFFHICEVAISCSSFTRFTLGFFFQIITRFLSLKKGDITLASNDWCSLTPVTVCPCISWRTRAGVAGARVTTGSLLTGTITARSNWNH